MVRWNHPLLLLVVHSLFRYAIPHQKQTSSSNWKYIYLLNQWSNSRSRRDPLAPSGSFLESILMERDQEFP